MKFSNPTSAAILFVAVALLAFAPGHAVAVSADEMFDDPKLEERAREIGKGLRCLVCQNQSIFDSNAALAEDLRVLVRERISAGDTDDQITEFIVTRYGNYVLLEPPVEPATYLLWIPPLLLLVGGAVMARTYLHGRARAKGGSELTKEERASAQRILEGGDS